MMLHSAGLAASYAYLASKAADDPETPGLAGAYARVGQALRERLVGLHLLTGEAGELGTPDVMCQLGRMDTATYARASAEAAALVSWLSRLAAAVAAENPSLVKEQPKKERPDREPPADRLSGDGDGAH
jgi:hypothetical protein